MPSAVPGGRALGRLSPRVPSLRCPVPAGAHPTLRTDRRTGCRGLGCLRVWLGAGGRVGAAGGWRWWLPRAGGHGVPWPAALSPPLRGPAGARGEVRFPCAGQVPSALFEFWGCFPCEVSCTELGPGEVTRDGCPALPKAQPRISFYAGQTGGTQSRSLVKVYRPSLESQPGEALNLHIPNS